jgi:BirA family biotin operon repressor/biotin-[acetyl-CoA-carboxylase] ligase
VSSGGVSGGGAFDVARFRALHQERGLGWGAPLIYARTTGSTNDDALAAARSGAPHGALFVAEYQRAGRGRHGKSWLGQRGESLFASIVLRPQLDVARAAALALVAGLAVRAAVARRSAEPIGVKWPNDVVAATRKLAGILVESSVRGNELGAVVVGVGINVTAHPPADTLDVPATSLAALGATELEREPLLCDVLAELAPRLARFSAGGIQSLHAELERYDALAGRRIDVEGTRGIARGIGAEGALHLETTTGMTTLVSGTVRFVE